MHVPVTSSSTTTPSRSSSHKRASTGCAGPGSMWPPMRVERVDSSWSIRTPRALGPSRDGRSSRGRRLPWSAPWPPGRADLVTMDGSVVHLRLSGGCQGCGMAKELLTQGIEGILREAVPEISDIVDVTNHAEGSNPFYQSTKG